MSSESSDSSRHSRLLKPPITLSKETVGVWTAWCSMGNKEVAREAATKGLHINLAITFLSKRLDTDFNESQIWFRREVVNWVNELLTRKQIFKASHILSNISLDTNLEFINIFRNTCDEELRDYIGSHLIKMEMLDASLNNLWHFLKIMIANVSVMSKLDRESIACLESQTAEWKSEVATLLFLKTDENILGSFVTSEALWNNLLQNNDLAHLILWIKLQCEPECRENFKTSNLINHFKILQISNDMLNTLSSAKHCSSDAILNEFSKFGLYCEHDRIKLISILKRLENSYNLAFVYDNFQKNFSNISLNTFMELLTKYCLDNKLLCVLNECARQFDVRNLEDGNLSLILNFRRLCADLNQQSLRNHIFNVSCSLYGNVMDYFNTNPLILWSLLLFTENVTTMELLKNNFPVFIKKLSITNALVYTMRELYTLNGVFNNKIRNSLVCNIDIYKLLELHLKLKSSVLFHFRFAAIEFSYFNSSEIVEKCGYSKFFNYRFYLKQSKPSLAAIFLQIEKYDSIKELDFLLFEKKVLKITVLNFICTDITSSCVSFFKMLGKDPLRLRVVTSIFKILLKEGYGKDYILQLLLNADDDPYTVQNLLETILLKRIDNNTMPSSSELLHALDDYEIQVQFSKIANIKLPESLLKHCAGLNLWLPFLIFSQVYNYPVDQIKLLIQFFKSPNMLEHLTHGVINDLQIEEKNILIRERDSRKYFLSKVGVRKSLEHWNQNLTASIMSRSQSSWESEGSSGSDFFEIDISNIKATLLQTLIRCHNSTDPPKAFLQACQLYRIPLLTIFATSYEPDSIITNWITWLAVSCELCQTFTNFETKAVNATAVSNLLEDCMKSRYFKNLLESLEIFLPDNPLRYFLEFLNDYIEFNFSDIAMENLTSFKNSLKNIRKNCVLTETDRDMTYLKSKNWIVTTALLLLLATINFNFNSLYEQIQIVKQLQNIEIWNYLLTEPVDFRNLLNILNSLYNSNVSIDFNISDFFDLKTKRETTVTCINDLLDKQCFETALEIAKTENLPPDLILIKQWKHKMITRNNLQFWDTCDHIFSQYNVTADCVVDFYIGLCENISDSLEKFTLLKLAWSWVTKFELSCQFEVEMKMWISILHVDDKHRSYMYFTNKSLIYLYKDMLEILKNIAQFEEELSKDFVQQLDRILMFVLNKGDFWLALRLQKMFGCKSQDLETLKLCHSLAEGILLPHQINTEQRLQLSNVSYLRSYSSKRTFLSTRLSSQCSCSHSPATSYTVQLGDTSDNSTNDTLAMLKLLTEHLHNGVDIAQNIFMLYRISINIEIPYDVVQLTADYMKIMKNALEDNCTNKLDVVHDFVRICKWSNNQIADFICEALITSTLKHVQTNSDDLTMWDLHLDTDFNLVLQLFQDNCSILGYRVYSYLSIYHKSQNESKSRLLVQDLAFVIELLIRAHDCFTADCNMEGISIVLKKCKEVISNLLAAQEWKLMVKLLTGVARYSEMNYVFEILMEHDQFEFLLRKGLRKDTTLKVALLEFLKRYCPDNGDLHKIVALHFTLFSEVAMLWEQEAQSIIKNLISISLLEMQNNKLNPIDEPFILFQNTDGTKNCLNKAMENFSHATDFHLQGEKLTKAFNSAKQAELLALQLGMLNDIPSKASSECILQLNNHQVTALISFKLNFEQCLIVVEAYNYQADWASVLYEQYVVKNYTTFLESFLTHLTLSDTLVHDISRKFIKSNTNSLNELGHMKKLLSRLMSIHVKYRIASELGFTDLVEDLIASGQLAYLKDTVWKKGFKTV